MSEDTINVSFRCPGPAQGIGPFPALTESCGIEAFGVVRAPLEGIAGLRLQPGPVVRPPLPPNFLKYSDEQTVVGLAAVYQAIHDFPLEVGSFNDWGVLAAPRYLGRLGVAEGLHKFQQGGPFKVSPMLIPNRSLHSVSSTISLALQSRGPNFGAGGGLFSFVEGLLAALTYLEEGRLPGLWLVLTQWDPEPVTDLEGHSIGSTTCHGLALACKPISESSGGWRLRLTIPVSPAGHSPTVGKVDGGNQLPSLLTLADFFNNRATPGAPRMWYCPLAWRGRLEVATAEGGP